MRRLAPLALLVALAPGCGSSAPFYNTTTPTLANEGRGPSRLVPFWIEREHLPPAALPGAKLFAVAGCTACHVYLGAGRSVLGGPNLSAIGRRNLGVKFEIRHLRCPSCAVPGSPMPPFPALGKIRLRELAIFLEASKGTH